MKRKLIIYAALFLNIFNLANLTISPAHAEVAIAAITVNKAPAVTDAKIQLSCTEVPTRLGMGCRAMKMVEDFSPTFMKINSETSRHLFARPIGDRLFNWNEKDAIVCLIEEGSPDGSIFCGGVDKQ
jgi:hypothetical protein